MSVDAEVRPPGAQALEAWEAFEVGQLSLLSFFDQSLLKNTGVGYLWFKVLDALDKAPEGLRLQDLAEKVFHSQSGTTRLVDRLNDAGLVARRPCLSDRRVIFAVLTELGKTKHNQACPYWQSLFHEHFWNRLTEEEKSSLVRISEKTRSLGEKPICEGALPE